MSISTPAFSRLPKDFFLKRELPEGLYPLSEVALGLEDSPALESVFPDPWEREKILKSVVVRVRPGQGYMRVDNADFTIIVAQDHLRLSDMRVVYLDFIHELVHIKQVRGGLQVFGHDVRYVDKDTEIEAYQVAIKEGRRIGMSEDEIRDYLDVPWITEDEYRVLLARLGVSPRQNI